MDDMIEQLKKVKAASRLLGAVTAEDKNIVLCSFAAKLRENTSALLAENRADLAAANAENGFSDAFLERLTLTEKVIGGMAAGVGSVAALPDPVGRVLSEKTLENGLYLRKTSVPLGVIGIIFEARPNVTADSAALCFKSGNACVLKGGREAVHSNSFIASLMREALRENGLPEDCVWLSADTSRRAAVQMMHADGFIDVLIPRGGKGLIGAVKKEASVPVIETGAGNCHMYIDEHADLAMAVKLALSAKVSRPSVCNSLEKLLVHESAAAEFLPMMADAFEKANVEMRGCERTQSILGARVRAAVPEDWYEEYNDLIIAVKVVSGVEEAVAHINEYSTAHSEAIVTSDDAAAAYFFRYTDSAALYRNASTRFTDGGIFGLGAEIGISTQKLHARGPMGLNELTTYKYMIEGTGQTR